MSKSASQLSDLSDELLHGERSVLLEGIADFARRAAPRRLDGALRESRFACTLPVALELLAGEPSADAPSLAGVSVEARRS